MPRLTFTLTVATSADGYIARSVDEPPQAWASPEEQDLFFRDVEAADWAIMGRNTHLAADRPDRRRVVFSTAIGGWQRPTQLWLDPAATTPEGLRAFVQDQHPLESGLILGGTRVHDWFLAHRAVDLVHLTIEPVRFGSGLPIFSDSAGEAPLEIFGTRGFEIADRRDLNATGTEYVTLVHRGLAACE